jgi:hypothetical protein
MRFLALDGEGLIVETRYGAPAASSGKGDHPRSPFGLLGRKE